MEGMAAVLPYALCTLFMLAQFEELVVCGFPDIDMLQRITQCLQDMNQAQRSLFVNFVLARSRLPRSIEEFTLHFKIQPAVIMGDDTNVPGSLLAPFPNVLFLAVFAAV
ncbi:E3 ubiquitin-protein ligase HERC2 [Aphanomyces astaci]|uniref:E3 ubiquitin-protein ligase HERC2 n=1 Tax=Aphanomyces astaci TaxID=112090 RepID=W4GTN6_APHAT|nr:E3 ubiquitin-protein ligase HERC2 [Aphanomyces astaci]ETV82384.1 E3 ubiquitin-protein ligase HERC2 [Aphanomyces astaci]|eukprot:XP_009828053.1 E3 ubiquitin-protein ligase HERC2 [Aphanomyces astaci]